MHKTQSSHSFVLLVLLCGLALPCAATVNEPLPAPVENIPWVPPMRTALEKAGHFAPYTAELQRLYGGHAFQLLWSRDGAPTPQATALTDALAHAADAQGLIPTDYEGPRLSEWLARLIAAGSLTGGGWPAFDIALSRALMHYGNHLHRGRIEANALSKLGISIQAKQPLDLPHLIEACAVAANPTQVLEQLAPATSVYATLKNALRQYRVLAEKTPPAPLVLTALQKSLRPGETRDNVSILRNLLQFHGYLDEELSPADANLYDDTLANAVRRFQANYSLEPDGVVGGQTLQQLNMMPAARVEQIRLGLERLRWLPESRDNAYLIVNVPSFRLYGYATGKPDLAKPDIGMNVIVGQAISTRITPVFHADMQYVVFRPYWNVPDSIARKELLPLIEKSDSYLAKNDMEIVANDGTTQDNLDALDAKQFRLRQRPGAKNALGPIKFVFPNMNDVYLHGTPMQRLFQKARRDFSHGCIRLEDPTGLAEFVLKKEAGWDRARIEKSMQGSQSFSVRLKGAIPVYIFYTTVLADEQGQVRFYPDIYGQDTQLLKLLNRVG